MVVFNITCLRWRHTHTDGRSSSQQNSDVKKRTRHFLTNCQKTSEDNAKKTDNNRRLAIYEYFWRAIANLLNFIRLFSATHLKSQLAASAFNSCDWMKVLAASLRVRFCDEWKIALSQGPLRSRWNFSTAAFNVKFIIKEGGPNLKLALWTS